MSTTKNNFKKLQKESHELIHESRQLVRKSAVSMILYQKSQARLKSKSSKNEYVETEEKEENNGEIDELESNDKNVYKASAPAIDSDQNNLTANRPSAINTQHDDIIRNVEELNKLPKILQETKLNNVRTARLIQKCRSHNSTKNGPGTPSSHISRQFHIPNPINYNISTNESPQFTYTTSMKNLMSFSSMEAQAPVKLPAFDTRMHPQPKSFDDFDLATRNERKNLKHSRYKKKTKIRSRIGEYLQEDFEINSLASSVNDNGLSMDDNSNVSLFSNASHGDIYRRLCNRLRRASERIQLSTLSEISKLLNPPPVLPFMFGFIYCLLFGVMPKEDVKLLLLNELKSLHSFIRQMDPFNINRNSLLVASNYFKLHLRALSVFSMSRMSLPLGLLAKWIVNAEKVISIIINIEKLNSMDLSYQLDSDVEEEGVVDQSPLVEQSLSIAV